MEEERDYVEMYITVGDDCGILVRILTTYSPDGKPKYWLGTRIRLTEDDPFTRQLMTAAKLVGDDDQYKGVLRFVSKDFPMPVDVMRRLVRERAKQGNGEAILALNHFRGDKFYPTIMP